MKDNKNKNKAQKEEKRNYINLIFLIIIPIIIVFIINKLYFQNNSQNDSSKPEKTAPVLISDIGGTNCRLRLLRISSDPDKKPNEIKMEILKPWDFQSLEQLLEAFLKPFIGTDDYPLYAVLGVPGVVMDNTMKKLVNIPHWDEVNGNNLAKKLHLKKLEFLNDFVCIGYGIQSSVLKKDKDYIIINNKEINNDLPKLVVGPGTGLGVCSLIKYQGDEYHSIFASEGSHADFSPVNQMQFDYMEHMKKYYNITSISSEKACSGKAVLPMYQYLGEYYKNKGVKLDINKELFDKVAKVDRNTDKNIFDKVNKEITQAGKKATCGLAVKTLEFFVELLANIAGNLSTSTFPTGGLYIVGGLSNTLSRFYTNDDQIFQKHYVKSGNEFNDILEKVPIILVKEENLGLMGTIECARRMVAKGKI